MQMKKQIIVVHGGDTFDTYEKFIAFLKERTVGLKDLKRGGWKLRLEERLGHDFDVLLPQMPNKENARYSEWKLLFEKCIPLFSDEAALLGHSLGGAFLAKYLAENDFPKKIKSLFLVAAPFDDAGEEYPLGTFSLPQNLEKLQKQARRVFIFHSRDDKVVPCADLGKYKKVFPEAQTVIFENRGHFNQEEFPELIERIQMSYAS